ncbi:outer membrane protein assembly factor BamA [Aliifodinibius sp. S!AR15-10]|uniref:outer membrane protein assembly factor BamA n=1 Tax=Aliifodinibius sp. S!AR15-10 TaxID=2950437 RepID=UPI0028647498|nr:outer membrane protein assembly factor BamA [Aliifodinibius sp. S!AR15-10]MDR8389789.1 outer membrane protein assembly factor BamA [Aliifodinibius sp. S!AR15-10]
MIQRLFTKALFFLLTFFTVLSTIGYAQDTAADSLDIEINNPLEVTPSQYEILSLTVEGGSHTVRPSFIKNTSGLEVGSTITIPGDDISQAIKRLNRTGIFSDIEINQVGSTANGIHLQISVVEQPRLSDYEIRGVKRSQRSDLRERLNLLSGFAVDKSSKTQAINTIKRFYREKGYWFTEVDVSTSEPDTVRNRVTMYFDIDPGERLEIKDIRFEGNDQYDEKKLRKTLDTIKEDRWWKFFSKKLFKQEDYEEAKSNLRSFYAENGFRDFRIVEDSVFTYNYKDDKEGVGVWIKVNEGPQYKVRNITWEGNTVYSDERLTQALGFQKGDVFNESKFDENLQYTQGSTDVTSLYHNIGYLFFQVQPEINVVAEDSLDIHLNIVEDEIATISEVSFTGNTKTHDDVVRRTLRTIPGETYSRQAIVRTVRELGTLGYFQAKNITPVPEPNYQDKTVDIRYELDESQSTDNFEFSGGFGGRGIGLILSAKLNFNNFSMGRALRGEGFNPIPSGDGQKLSLGVQVTGSGYQSYNFGFQEPWLSGKPLSLGVNFNYNLIKYRNTNIRNELFSSSVSLGKRLKWPDDYFTQRTVLSYQLYDVAGGASFLAEGTSSILSIKEVIERNSLDNPISPTSGSKLMFSLEVAPPLPSFAQFYKAKTSYQNHTTLAGKLVFTNTVEYGYLGYLGSGQRSNFQRFMLGGTQLQQRQSFINDNIDLRGYPGGNNGSITPRIDGEEVGGRLYSKYSLELRYPAVSEDQVQVIPYLFTDAGNAYLNLEDFSPFNVKRATGVGVRIFLPILGLVDLSYGYRLDGLPGTNPPVNAGEWEFLFNIGTPF